MTFARTLAFIALATSASLAMAKQQTVLLNVPTMDCATCPITIKAALTKVPGVSKVKVSYEKREAVIVYDDTKATVGPEAGNRERRLPVDAQDSVRNTRNTAPIKPIPTVHAACQPPCAKLHAPSADPVAPPRKNVAMYRPLTRPRTSAPSA